MGRLLALRKKGKYMKHLKKGIVRILSCIVLAALLAQMACLPAFAETTADSPLPPDAEASSLAPLKSYGIDISGGVASGPGYTWDATSKVITFTTAANGNTYTLTQTGEQNVLGIVVASGVDAAVVLRSVTLTTTLPCIKLEGSARLTLTLEGESTLTSSDGAGIAATEGASLIIDGDGKLEVRGGFRCAGIGGGDGESGGTITINGGSVTTTGGNWHPNTGGAGGAGIGGGCAGDSGGAITISGGTVTATGGYRSAGIGGGSGDVDGNGGSGGIITINGGSIIATGNGGAGIGGGSDGSGGIITINDGSVIAASGGALFGGAGIGGGAYGESGGSITINGGTVTTTGGGGAGIGGGFNGEGGDITITDGIVTASGGAGIGGGYGSDGGNVIISGGTVTATGGSNGAGIGGGLGGNSGNIAIIGGTVTATGGSNLGGAGIGGCWGGSGEIITISGGTVTATGGSIGAGIGGALNGTSGIITISGGTVTATGGGIGDTGIGGGANKIGDASSSVSISPAAEVYAFAKAPAIPAIDIYHGNAGTGHYVLAYLDAASYARTLAFYANSGSAFSGSFILPADYTSFAYTTGTAVPRTDHIFAYQTSDETYLGQIERVADLSPNIASTSGSTPMALRLSNGGTPPAPPPDDYGPKTPVTQHEGKTRQDTAARASAKAYPDPAEVDSVILAYSYDFPDALAASYLAGALDAPILLCDTNEIPEATASELSRLNPSVVYIVGGIGVISKDVEDVLRATPGVSFVTRLGGAGREETAYLIASEAKVHGGVPTTAFIADAANFPDALSAGSLSAGQGVPILLTATGALDGWASRFLEENNISDIIVVGGPGSVSEGVIGQLGALPHTPAVTRWSGSDRYATSADALSKAIAKWNLTPTVIGLASGDGFPDALVGGAAVGNRGGLLAITDPDSLSAAAEGLISTYGDTISGVEIFGGTGTIRVADETRGLLS
jgi:putative cell wall-binding protein